MDIRFHERMIEITNTFLILGAVTLCAGLASACKQVPDTPSPVPEHAVFSEGLIGDIHPDGWIEEFLRRQQTGMTGVPESMSYPYNTCLWAGNITRNPEEHGEDWWRYEQTAYYTDGLLRLGYLLDDEALISKGEAGIEYTFSHTDEEGRLPHSRFSYASMWPMSVFFRAVKAYCEVHGDGDIPQKLTDYYLDFSMKEFQHWRNIISIEGMLWAYGKTGNQELLDRAVTAWNAGKFGDLTPEACAADTIPSMHGVTFNEELKLPVLLYAYTGEERYLDLARNVIANMDRDELLPDGVNVSAEYLLGNDHDLDLGIFPYGYRGDRMGGQDRKGRLQCSSRCHNERFPLPAIFFFGKPGHSHGQFES